MGAKATLPCPKVEDHTVCPEGYMQWHSWAETMAKTHRQRKCPVCNRYAIWEPKARVSPPHAKDAADGQ